MPTAREMAELVAFLPKLTAEGFRPVKRWQGGNEARDGVLTMPWPEYAEEVVEFFLVASGDCWMDPDYVPKEAGRLLSEEDAVRTADLAQIKTMLTYCVRGERFCDGHWERMIQEGHIEKLLQRVAELRRERE